MKLSGMTHSSSAMSMYENENEIVTSCFLPGLSEDQVKITVHNNVLSISGCNVSGQFQQSITLPVNVAADDIKQEYNNDILQVRIRKYSAK